MDAGDVIATDVNSAVTLECRLTKTSIIRWRYHSLLSEKYTLVHTGEALTSRYNSTGRFSVSCTSYRTPATCSLTIQPVHFHDGGDYQCFLTSNLQTRQNFQLIVIGTYV